MVVNLVKRVVGSANERYLKRLGKNVDAINALETELEALSDADLRARTDTFRRRISDGETLDSLLVEAFATRWVATHDNAAARRELETRLAAVLDSDVPRDAKDFVCRKLRVIGNPIAVGVGDGLYLGDLS